MIVCVAPTSNHFDDTHNTLLYADRATKIKTKVVTRNVVNVDRHVGQYVEAINRLNSEVAELKAKLAGKVNAEAEIVRRRKEQARAEVDRAKEDVQRKADQTKVAIIAGAYSEANLFIARSRMQAYNLYLTKLKAQASSDSPSAETASQQTMLESLISTEDSQLKPGSDLQSQLMRSQNASNMFEAILRAVTERRSDRLDDGDIDMVRLDAQYQKSQMERLKAEGQRDALQAALASQSELVANLVGILTRCIVMLEDGSTILRNAVNGGSENLVEKATAVSASLHQLAEYNNSAFQNLLGRSVSPSTSHGSSLLNFGSQTFNEMPASAGSTSSLHAQIKPSRRVSSAHLGVPDGTAHRLYRSPRKSLRSSLASRSLYARRSSIKPVEKKKGVQWKDEVGQGSLDDAGNGERAPSPMMIDTRPNSRASDWEDEKTDDSSNFSPSILPERDPLPARTGPRRPSRLDPSFLKKRSASGSLASLPEDEEPRASGSSQTNPFSGHSTNVPTLSESSIGSSSSMPELDLSRRNESTPPQWALKAPDSSMRSTRGNTRRRSNIGPLRSEKIRRRSSLLPTPGNSSTECESENVPEPTKTGPRRVPIVHTPAKRPKRLSMLGRTTRTPLLSRPVINIRYSDPNGSGEMSNKRPCWR